LACLREFEGMNPPWPDAPLGGHFETTSALTLFSEPRYQSKAYAPLDVPGFIRSKETAYRPQGIRQSDMKTLTGGEEVCPGGGGMKKPQPSRSDPQLPVIGPIQRKIADITLTKKPTEKGRGLWIPRSSVPERPWRG